MDWPTRRCTKPTQGMPAGLAIVERIPQLMTLGQPVVTKQDS